MDKATAKFIVSPALIVIACFCTSAGAASPASFETALPTAADIGTRAQTAHKIADSFMQQTANLRLSYHYNESFTDPADRGQLLTLAQKASGDLQRIFQTQQEDIFRIENYDGSDWDRLDGRTGLWRKLRLDGQETLWLKAQGKLEDYHQLLFENFNCATVDGLMCRDTINVGWQGDLFDCDFNQMLDLDMGRQERRFLWDINPEALLGDPITTGRHCFGCTAGHGSSCDGAIS